MLEVKDLHCKFGGNEVLKGVSFSVSDGEIAAIIGRSGAGKTTIMRILCGLEKQSHGTVLINGGPAKNRDLGLVPQGCHLFEHMTVIKNVAYALRAVKKLSKSEAYDVSKKMLSQFGLCGKFDEYPSKLSGGQKQRVAIARTLVMDPKILLFDEPTSALDPEMTSEVSGVIKQVAARGIGIVVVTHDLMMARNVANRILFLENGEMVENCQADKFFACPSTDRAKQFLKCSGCM